MVMNFYFSRLRLRGLALFLIYISADDSRSFELIPLSQPEHDTLRLTKAQLIKNLLTALMTFPQFFASNGSLRSMMVVTKTDR